MSSDTNSKEDKGIFFLKKIINHQSSNTWFQTYQALFDHHLCDYYGTICNNNCSFTEIILILYFQTSQKNYQSDIKPKYFKLA